MIFTQRFFILFLLGLPVSLVIWGGTGSISMMWRMMLAYDLVLFVIAFTDYKRTEDTSDFEVKRVLPQRFMIGEENSVEIEIRPKKFRRMNAKLKDEYPPELELRGDRVLKPVFAANGRKIISSCVKYKLYAASRGSYDFGNIVMRFTSALGLTIKQVIFDAAESVKVYPNINEARKHQLSARHNRQLMVGGLKTRLRGQGKEFESLRDYVRGDEIRNISWTATARKGRPITKQYQVERNQSIFIMIDAGRLMTSRIGHLSKLDYAINAALSIAYVAAEGGDNIGLLVFNRQVVNFIPPRKGHAQLNAIIEALHAIKPQMTEPSYSRAFQYLAKNCKKRSLVIVLTDLIDSDASAELLANTATLLPRHLPLIVTISDKDLRQLVVSPPSNIREVYQQSVAEELLHQRGEALAEIAELGGLALDVTAGQLSIQLINKYLDVKERGLL